MTAQKTLIIAAISTFAAVTAAPAFAADDVTFAYAKSELQSAKKMHKLYDRIHQRSAALCSNNGARSLAAKQFVNQCKADLVNDFVKGIDNRALTAMHTDEADSRRYAQYDQ